MGKVIVMNGATLDGVMQGPGRPDEDMRDGFAHGGWGIPYAMRRRSPRWASGWAGLARGCSGGAPTRSCWPLGMPGAGPFKDALNDARKYVASGDPATRLDWPNSTLLHGDVPAAVADLKQSSSANLVIMGSGVLIGSLRAADLIDEYLLMIAPLVLGTGRRLFAGGTPASLRLTESTLTTKGVVIASYEPARD